MVLLSQPADAGGGRLARRLLGRAERGADLVVAEVVAVAEHDGRALLRRQAVGQRRELLEGGPPVLDRRARAARRAASRRRAVVDDDPARDRQHPGAQVVAVLEPRVGPQRAQERLLERVLGALAPEPPRRGSGTPRRGAPRRRSRTAGSLPSMKRTPRQDVSCEARRRRSRRVGRVRPGRARARGRARSSTRSRRGRRPPAAARSPPSSSRISTARRISSRRSATTSSAGARARSSRRAGSPCTPSAAGEPQRRAFTYVDERRRADDHRARPQARPAGRRRLAAVGGARALRRGLLRQRRRRGAARSAARARARRDRARARDAAARRASELDVLVGSGEDPSRALRAGRARAAAAHRRHDVGRARRLDPPGRPVPRGAAARPDRGRLRLRRLLRRRPHLRARPRDRRSTTRSRSARAAAPRC